MTPLAMYEEEVRRSLASCIVDLGIYNYERKIWIWKKIATVVTAFKA